MRMRMHLWHVVAWHVSICMQTCSLTPCRPRHVQRLSEQRVSASHEAFGWKCSWTVLPGGRGELRCVDPLTGEVITSLARLKSRLGLSGKAGMHRGGGGGGDSGNGDSGNGDGSKSADSKGGGGGSGGDVVSSVGTPDEALQAAFNRQLEPLLSTGPNASGVLPAGVTYGRRGRVPTWR